MYIYKELAKRLQEQEGRPLSIEDRDRLIAIETQDCELAKLLQDKVKLHFVLLNFKSFYKRSIIALGKSQIEKSS